MSTSLERKGRSRRLTYIVGLLEAVVDGVSDRVVPLDAAPFALPDGAARFPSKLCDFADL